MPQTKQAKIALRQSLKKNLVHSKTKKEIKDLIKKIKQSASQLQAPAKKKENFLKEIRELEKKIDKAAKKRIFHKNKAARIKSRLWKVLQKQSQAEKDTTLSDKKKKKTSSGSKKKKGQKKAKK